MQSELQKANTRKNWIKKFRLQILHNIELSCMLSRISGFNPISKNTYYLNEQRNRLTEKLQESIEKDYQLFKQKFLANREKLINKRKIKNV